MVFVLIELKEVEIGDLFYDRFLSWKFGYSLLRWYIELTIFWLKLHFPEFLEFFIINSIICIFANLLCMFGDFFPSADMDLNVVPSTYGLSSIVIWLSTISRFSINQDLAGICLILIVKVS